MEVEALDILSIIENWVETRQASHLPHSTRSVLW